MYITDHSGIKLEITDRMLSRKILQNLEIQ